LELPAPGGEDFTESDDVTFISNQMVGPRTRVTFRLAGAMAKNQR
jgi:hypothetical protein